MKKIVSILLAVVMSFSMVTFAFAADFSDTDNIPQSEAIDVVNTLGIVAGYGNNVFGPNDILTRAQLCTMLTRALYGEPIYSSTNQFKDVAPNHWASAFINTAAAYGLMAGYGGGMFGPEDHITYTQMGAVIMKALGYDCGKLGWPNGVNSMSHTLGLFDNVKFDSYNDGCTRAHAAQMIYNAFDLNYVNHMADYPVTIKTKTFLADGLGFKETVEEVNGHKFVAYIDLDDGEVYTTENRLTYEQTIYPVKNSVGMNFHYKNSSKSHAIDWYWLDGNFDNGVILYINGTEITDRSNELFDAAGKAIGVFDEDDKLIAIHVESVGVDYIYGINGSNYLNEIIDGSDKDYNPDTSTVTYFAETQTYIISNKVKYGWVTDAYKSAIYVDGSKYECDNSPVQFEKNDFVKMYYNYRNELVAIVVIENPYIYDLTDKMYHTSECDIWNETVNHHYHTSIENMKSCELCAAGTYEFDACRDCHAKTGTAHNGKDITVVK